LVRFHQDEFDEMICNLVSYEYARSFEQNPTVPQGVVEYFSKERGCGKNNRTVGWPNDN